MSVRYRFGDFDLDVAERSLTRRAGDDPGPANTTRVTLQPKTLDLLAHLVTNAGKLHTKQALLDVVWGNVVVTENSLTQTIHQLRAALDDTAEKPRFIETVQRVGYRFIAPVVHVPTTNAVQPALPRVAHTRFYRGVRYAIVALIGVAITYFIAEKFWLPQALAPGRTSSVAVLPFKNIGNDPSNEAFADGIPETLLTMLAQLHELRVIGRTSSFSFKGKDVDLRTIGEALGVGAVLEGSVQRSGDRLRVNAQLISTVDGVHLWAENFERPVTDIFAVQDEIARRVAEALKVTLAGKFGPGSAGTQNFEAYQLNLEAKHLIQTRQSTNRLKAIPKLERAVELDPNYGGAWVGLSFAYDGESRHGESERAVQRALEVAPDTAGPHLALGYLLMHTGRDGAGEAMARGLELAPQDPFALISVATEYRLRSGRYAESAALMRRALKLDPRSAAVHLAAAFSFEANDDLSGALAQIQEVLRLEPEMGLAYSVAGGMLYGIVGRMDEALRFIRRARMMEPDDVRAELVTGYAMLGEHERAAHELESQRQNLDAVDAMYLPMLRAQIGLLAGRDEAARELLAQAWSADPPDPDLLLTIDEFGLALTRPDAQHLLERLRTIDPDWLEHASDPLERYAPICTVAWSGDRKTAATLLARWESFWRSHVAYSMGTGDVNRGPALARALACIGRNDDALTELESLVAKGYHAGGWRALAADHAYDAIREDPRFVALQGRLRSVADAERQRFLERPDLADGDIDALTDTAAP